MSAGKVSKSGKSPAKLIRPMVHALHPYVPGEQPRIRGLVKLNTNENPYPPSPKVIEATKAAVDGRLRLYPNPTAQALREKLAKLHKWKRWPAHWLQVGVKRLTGNTNHVDYYYYPPHQGQPDWDARSGIVCRSFPDVFKYLRSQRSGTSE